MACRKTHFRLCLLDFDIRYSRPSTPTFPFLALSGHLLPALSHYDLHPVVHHHPPRYTSSTKARTLLPSLGPPRTSPPPPLSAFILSLLASDNTHYSISLCRSNRNILSHNANDTITCLCCCFCTKVNMQHRTKFQSRALVDGHTQENKSDKATSQQCTATHAVSDRDTFIAECDMDAVLIDALQRPRLGTAKRLESVN
jgi:hypothetical protein